MWSQKGVVSALIVSSSFLLVQCGPDHVCEVDCQGNLVCDRATATCVATRPTVPASEAPAQNGLPCDVQQVLQNNCVSCHGATPSGGAPMSLTTRAQLLAASNLDPTRNLAQRSLIRMTAATSPMPPAIGPIVPTSQVNAFAAWVNQGTPVGSCGGTGAGGGAGGGSGQTGAGGGVGTQAGTGGGVGTQSGAGGGSTQSGAGGGSTQSGAGGGTQSGTGGGGGTTTAPLYCRACTVTADCGTVAAGNFCLDDGMGGGYCGTKCSSNANCTTAATCVSITDANNNVVGKNCVPTNGICPATSGAGGGGGGGGTSGTGGGAGGGGGAATCTDTWANYAGSFFSSNCSSCHNSEFSSVSAVSSNQSNIKSRINSGNMPPGGLSAASKARIMAWFTCGLKP